MFAGRRNVLLLAFSQALMLSAVVLSWRSGLFSAATLRQTRVSPRCDCGNGDRHGYRFVAGGPADAPLWPARWLPDRSRSRTGRQPAVRVCAPAEVVRTVLRRTSAPGQLSGFANYYRFAAVEATEGKQCEPCNRLGLAGGVVAAFLGPLLAQWGRDWIAGNLFVGSYLAQGALSLVALAMLTQA